MKITKKILKDFALSLDSEIRCPQEYVKKYNRNYISEMESFPSGRAWIIWFIDKFFRENKIKNP